MISFDSETTGVDFYHGAKPFFVTSTSEDGSTKYFEWDVEPTTREPIIPEGDLEDIQALIGNTDLCLQNSKFDVTAMAAIGLKVWPWARTHDTLTAGHLLATNQKHDLTSMLLHYLGVDIRPYEKALEVAVKECRRIIQQAKQRVKREHKKKQKADSEYTQALLIEESGELFADWKIAAEGVESMPSAGDEPWRYDYWLPRAMAKELGLHPEHEYWTVLSDYSNADSASTLALWQFMEKEMHRRGVWEIYLEKVKTNRIAYEIERRGITVNKNSLYALTDEYTEESESLANVCLNIAAEFNYPLQLAKGASINNSMVEFIFDVLKVKKRHKKNAKTDRGSLDKESMALYLAELPEKSKALLFLQRLIRKRKMGSDLSYMEGYQNYWQHDVGDFYRLHPNLNPTGTVHLRWSSNNPNEQNISKQPREGGHNLRWCFGPANDREWWSCDAKNIELRIPAYEAGEDEMINLFERPVDPPYFGSNHLLVAHILHPKLFEECRDEQGNLDGRVFKKRYADTWYQWVKNGNFAVQYGAIETSGTADRAYHVIGGQALIQNRFKKIKQLNESLIRYAEKNGYVETIPDKTVNPDRGYPILCTRTEYGKILPTTPLNYHTSGTACWWAVKAMNRMQPKLEEWSAQCEDGKGYYICMYVHDEFVFDFPKSTMHPRFDATKEKTGKTSFRTSNLWRIRILQGIMEQGGTDINIPTPTSCEYHEHNWETGVSL